MLQLEELLELRSSEFWRGEPMSPGCVFDPFMYGRSVNCAQPAIIFSCLSKTVRRNAKSIIEYHDFKIDPRGIGIDYHSSSPGSFAGTASLQSSGVISLASSEGKQSLGKNLLGLGPSFLDLGGESIQIGSATCTLGGLIAIDGTLYYQTVAHVFEIEDTESKNTPHPSPSPVIYGVGVERLGVLHRKRHKPNANTKDMDWAIFVPDRTRGDMPLKKSSCVSKYPTTVIQDVSGSAEVLVRGRLGEERGMLLGDYSLVALPGTGKFQRMWAVMLERDIAQGDCGSWVLDATGQSLYGHIVAGKAGTGLAYLVLARIVFEDIRIQCGATQVTLPTEDEIYAYATTASGRVKSATQLRPGQGLENEVVDIQPPSLRHWVGWVVDGMSFRWQTTG